MKEGSGVIYVKKTPNFRQARVGLVNIDPIVRDDLSLSVYCGNKRFNQERAMRTWMCLICGWIYEEELGLPEEGIPPGTKWEDVPPNWVCPECGARKEDFEMMEI